MNVTRQDLERVMTSLQEDIDYHAEVLAGTSMPPIGKARVQETRESKLRVQAWLAEKIKTEFGDEDLIG